jgi:hypothetical protein
VTGAVALVRADELRTCLLCRHAMLGEQTYCRAYEEFILDERSAAADCEGFTRDPCKR